jgi:hypothetical protein
MVRPARLKELDKEAIATAGIVSHRQLLPVSATPGAPDGGAAGMNGYSE